MPDKRITKCCAGTKHVVRLLSDRANARQSRKAVAFLDLHSGVDNVMSAKEKEAAA